MPWFSRSKDKKKPTTSGGLFDGRRYRRSHAGNEDSRRKINTCRSVDFVSEAGSGSGKGSRSPSPSSPSNSRGRHSCGQPLPLPCAPPMKSMEQTYPGSQLSSAPLTSLHHVSFMPLPAPTQVVRPMEFPTEADYASGSSSVSSLGSVEVADSRHGRLMPSNSNLRPMQQDGEPPDQPWPSSQTGQVSTTPRGRMVRNAPSRIETSRSMSPLPGSRQPVSSPTSRVWSPVWQGEGLYPPPILKIPQSDNSMSSPVPSPRSFLQAQCSAEPVMSGSVSPRSGNNSTYNSWQGDVAPPWPPHQYEERSSSPSPQFRSPGPSRTHSATVSPLHPRAVIRTGGGPDSPTTWQEEVQGRSPYSPMPLPLPPVLTGSNSPYSSPPITSGPSTPTLHSRHPSRTSEPSRSADLPASGTPTKWQKGKLLGSGTFGNVYVGFNNDNGGFCAMKEVLLVSDDEKSKESVKQLGQEISLLSKLRHENIVQYIGTEMLENRLYIYLEYGSGGSIYKLLQEYGAFKEPVVRNYTRQILSGLAYLHNQNTVHRDIKGANILVDTNGMVKLADFGMAKHISAQSFLQSFKGSPYWMAPEVIKHTGGYDLAVDIWSLGCTVLEMVTTKPPWHQYEGVAAMFKIGNSKELPAIPDSLSTEGQDFVRLCLQRDPAHRPTASCLLQHPFVQDAPRVCRPDDTLAGADNPPSATVINKSASPTVNTGRGNVSALHENDAVNSTQHRKVASTSELSPRGHGGSSPFTLNAKASGTRTGHQTYNGTATQMMSSGLLTPTGGGYGNSPLPPNQVMYGGQSAHLNEGYAGQRAQNGGHAGLSMINGGGGFSEPRKDCPRNTLSQQRTPGGSPRERSRHNSNVDTNLLEINIFALNKMTVSEDEALRLGHGAFR